MGEAVQRRRILCIDGGGILGTFPAAFLAELEKNLEEPIGRYFDLIAGTSTGGILAIGMGLGLSAKELLQMYEDRGPEIFGQSSSPILNFAMNKVRRVRHVFRRKYSSDPLRNVLEDVLGELKLGDAKTRLLIPAWDATRRQVYIYKTPHHLRLKTDFTRLAVDAAMATAAAPTYFSQHVSQDEVGLVDGGIWANNPIALAVVEAITLLGWPADGLDVLSISCLSETYSVRSWGGIGTLGKKLIKLFMDGQSHGALGMAKLLTGDEHDGRKVIHRIDPVVPEGEYNMDDPGVVSALKGLGHSHAREQLPILEKIFFVEPVEPFVPLYTP